MIKKAHDCGNDITDLLKPGVMRGKEAGFLPILNEHYTSKLGNTTLITGYPSSGKSFFTMNLQAALTKRWGWKHLLYTPEMGTAAEIYMTMIEILTGSQVGYGLTERQVTDILPFVHENFFVFEPESNPTMDKITTEIGKLKSDLGVNTFSIDNLNDLTHIMTGTQDIYFEQQMLLFNNCAKNNNMHGFLLAHPAKPMPDDLLHPPAPDKIKGGSAFWSKGQTILSLRDDVKHLEVTVYKAKPRYAAKKGEFVLNKEYTQSTYSQTVNDKKIYLFPQVVTLPVPKQSPSLSFAEPKTDSYENPSF